MAVVNFEEIMKEKGLGMKLTPGVMMNEVNPFRVQDSEALAQAQELYRKAYVNKKRIDDLQKVAAEVCEKAKEQVLEASGFKDFEDESMKVQHIRRDGNVDWKKFEVSFPEIQLDPYRKAPSFFWTVKLKLRE